RGRHRHAEVAVAGQAVESVQLAGLGDHGLGDRVEQVGQAAHRWRKNGDAAGASISRVRSSSSLSSETDAPAISSDVGYSPTQTRWTATPPSSSRPWTRR